MVLGIIPNCRIMAELWRYLQIMHRLGTYLSQLRVNPVILNVNIGCQQLLHYVLTWATYKSSVWLEHQELPNYSTSRLSLWKHQTPTNFVMWNTEMFVLRFCFYFFHTCLVIIEFLLGRKCLLIKLSCICYINFCVHNGDDHDKKFIFMIITSTFPLRSHHEFFGRSHLYILCKDAATQG